VDVRVITADGVTRHSSDELETLLDGPGLVWIDVKYWDADTAAVLAKRLNLHDRAVHECAVRNPVAKVHTYPDQAFVVLHAPEQGRGGHVHFVELDQVVGPNWLLTVHGPMNVAVELDAAYVETSTVARRLAKAKFSVHLGLYPDETARCCKWRLPLSHPLESWGDACAVDGTARLRQRGFGRRTDRVRQWFR